MTGVRKNRSSSVRHHNVRLDQRFPCRHVTRNRASELVPEWGMTRLFNMVRDRGDWVISRQRAWGVRFQSSMLKMERRSSHQRRSTISRTCSGNMGQTSGMSVSERLVASRVHTSEQSKREFRKELDIMDVWSIQVLLTQACSKNVRIYAVGRLVFRRLGSISWAGSTPRSRQRLPRQGKHRIVRCSVTDSSWTETA